MRELNIRKPVVVGHSLGAAVAVEAGRRGLASRIVLLDGDALSSGGPPGWLRGALFQLPYFDGAASGAALVVAGERSSTTRTGLSRHPDIPASLWTDQLRAEGERGALREWLARDRRLRHPTRRCTPAKVVWGQFDNVDSAKAGRATAATLHAPFVTVPAGRQSMLVAPAAVARDRLGRAAQPVPPSPPKSSRLWLHVRPQPHASRARLVQDVRNVPMHRVLAQHQRARDLTV